MPFFGLTMKPSRVNRSDFIVKSSKYIIFLFIAIVGVPLALESVVEEKVKLIQSTLEISTSNLIYTIFSATAFLIFIANILLLGIKRLHDFNLSGWWIIVKFIPPINFVLLMVLMFFPGTKGNNKYGIEPKKPPYWKVVLATLLCLFLIPSIMIKIFT